MRWRSWARYSAYSAGGPPPGPLPPGPLPAPGVTSANPWPARAATPAPPDTPLATVVDSLPPRPAPTGDVPGEAVAALDESRSLDAVAVAEGSASTDVRASTEVEASTEVGGSTEPRVIGAIAGGAIFVGAGVSGTLLAAIAASERLAAERSAISGGSGET